MKAAVLFAPGQPLWVEELDLEPPREGEVLVRMPASEVRHSCLHAADGGQLRLDELITRRYGLDEVNEAFRDLAAGELARGVVVS